MEILIIFALVFLFFCLVSWVFGDPSKKHLTLTEEECNFLWHALDDHKSELSRREHHGEISEAEAAKQWDSLAKLRIELGKLRESRWK
ncbi:MAG: hypothetical protein ACK4UN_09935 [Limisphaerales bacterium]